MSKREAAELRESLPGELLTRQRGLLRSGRVKSAMSTSNPGTVPATTTASGGRQDGAENSVAESVEVRPEVTENLAKTGGTDVHQLLEQMARMRERLNVKEAELAEVKSELTFALTELETAREEVNRVVTEAETAKEEVNRVRKEAEETEKVAETIREEMEGQIDAMKRERDMLRMECELQKYREIEELRRDWDKERNYLREVCEREAAEAKKWKQRRGEPVRVRQEEDTAASLGAENVTVTPHSLPAEAEETTTSAEGVGQESSVETIPPGTPLDLRMPASKTTPERGRSHVTFAEDLEMQRSASCIDTAGVLTGVGSEQSSLQSSSTTSGGDDTIARTVTQLLEAQRRMMEAQVQAMAAQTVPPLNKFSGENINTDEGSIDRWVEQFEERARVAGWSEEQKLFQLKAHLEKTADHTVRMLPEGEKTSYSRVIIALQKRFCSLDIKELRGLEFHQLMQDKQSVEELGIELQKLGRKAFPTSI